MHEILRLGPSFIDEYGRKWVDLSQLGLHLDDPSILSFKCRPVIPLEEFRELVSRHGLQSSLGGLQRDLTEDWSNWFTGRLNALEGPSRLALREATKVLDGAIAHYERVYWEYTGQDVNLTLDYLYSQFTQIMGLESSVDIDDMSQWELNLLTTVTMSFSALLLAYLQEDFADVESILPHITRKLSEDLRGLSQAMEYATNLIDKDEYTRKYG